MPRIAQVGLPPDEDRGRRLVELIRDANKSQSEVAEATGLSSATVRNAERGKEISLRTLHSLADYYGVQADWVVTGKGEREAGGSFFDRLGELEEKVDQQGKAIAEIKNLLAGDRRWERVEQHLNFLSDRLSRVSEGAQDEDEEGESQQWSPIDLSPGEPAP